MGEPARVGKRGTIVIPAKLRKRFHMEEGSLVLFDEGRDGVVIRPAEAIPVEIYTKERKAGFLLENSVGPAGYARACPPGSPQDGSRPGQNPTHLITGDLRDFKPLFGRKIGGVLVLRPRDYLARR